MATQREPATRKRKSEDIYKARNSYTDRAKFEREGYPPLTLTIDTIETTLLLLDSQEDNVLISVLNAFTKFMRKQDENIAEIRDKGILEQLLAKEFYINNENTLIRRFALYIGEMIIESIHTLKDLETEKVQNLMQIALEYYVKENDDFCLEYLGVIVNKCCDDPQVTRSVLNNSDYLDKLFELISITENPDILLHSFEALSKVLHVQSFEEMHAFVANTAFPIDRILCDLTNEFPEIRVAALQLLKILIPECENEESLFDKRNRDVFALQQLAKLLCGEVKCELILPIHDAAENAGDSLGGGGDAGNVLLGNKQLQKILTDVIDVLATALRIEKTTRLFFEHGLFEKVVGYLHTRDATASANANARLSEVSKAGEVIDDNWPRTKCQITMIFAEIAKFEQFLYRLHMAHVTQSLLDCVLEQRSQEENEAPATHILLGLNRMMKFNDAAQQIAENMAAGLIRKLMNILQVTSNPIKTREQAAELINNLIVFTYHPTVCDLLQNRYPELLADIFGTENLELLSIDLLLPLLATVEHFAQNEQYRQYMAESSATAKNLAQLLKRTFDTAALTRGIFRCISTLVDEESVRRDLLDNFISKSIIRALKSLSNSIKSDATNFIMQTTRFPEFLQEYIDQGVLETLIMNQKHAYCVSTWVPAIDSILSKDPTLKFCIRNHLGFTDITVGHDFHVSKKKFDDFRVFMSIMKEDVSPMLPVIVANFERQRSPSAFVVEVPSECFLPHERGKGFKGWCYCRKPGDDVLPRYLQELNCELEREGLCMDAAAARRCIDFENIAKRVRVVAEIVNRALGDNLKVLDINSDEECSEHEVRCHYKELCMNLHCNFIPLGIVRTGCQFERAILFKCLSDQIGLPVTLQRSVNGRLLFNEVALPIEVSYDVHCDPKTMQFMPWRLLRPTHIVDLIYNIGDLYAMQSRQALQYLRLM